LTRLVGGIEELNDLPDAIFVVGAREENIALLEAAKKKIPIVALVDTNIDPKLIDYIIPANDDAVKSIELITNVIAEAVIEGKKKVKDKNNIKKIGNKFRTNKRLKRKTR